MNIVPRLEILMLSGVCSGMAHLYFGSKSVHNKFFCYLNLYWRFMTDHIMAKRIWFKFVGLKSGSCEITVWIVLYILYSFALCTRSLFFIFNTIRLWLAVYYRKDSIYLIYKSIILYFRYFNKFNQSCFILFIKDEKSRNIDLHRSSLHLASLEEASCGSWRYPWWSATASLNQAIAALSTN